MECNNVNAGNVSHDHDEFEEMKTQVSLLRKKLDSERMVNDKLMRRVMKEKVSSVNTYITKVIVCGLLAIVLLNFDFTVLFPLSGTFLVFSNLMMVCALSYTIWNKILLGSVNMMEDNLLDVCHKLVRFKQREIRYLYIGAPVILLWLGYFTYEVNTSIEDPAVAYSLSFSGGIGGVIGFSIGIYMFRKMIKNVNDVVEHIGLP